MRVDYLGEYEQTYTLEQEQTSECSICHRKLKPICDTKTVDGITYCIDCYKKHVYPFRMKKLRENKK